MAGIMAQEGLDLDVVSGGELAIARRWGSRGAHPLHGNNKSEEELNEALDYGIARVIVETSTRCTC